MEISLPTGDGEAMPEAHVGEDRMFNSSTLLECRWFAAYTATHHEKQALELLTKRQIDCYLPLYRAYRHWKKQVPVSIDLPLFPNYIFVHITQSQRAMVLGTPAVYAIVGSGPKAWELPTPEIEALRAGLPERKVQPHPYLTVGNRARIRSGVMAGLEGVIVRQKNNLHLVLSLDQIMQSIAIEVAPEELEPVSSSPARLHPGSAKNIHGAVSAAYVN